MSTPQQQERSAWEALAALPPVTTPYRTREWLTLVGLLRDPAARLVTVTGPLGVGKTHLARAVAEELRGEFAAVRAVGAEEFTAPDAVYEAGERRLLLVDGGPRPAAPEAVRALAASLARDPGLVVLATGPAPLRIAGERQLPLAPLPVPLPGDGHDLQELGEVPAVALFVQQARNVTPAFALTEENAPAVAGLCIRLEGHPLALELAAGRLRLFSPQALAARLRQSAGALTALSGGPADAPERHRSLGALAAAALEGVTGPERELLDQLAVFEPGFGLPVAERTSPLPRAATDSALETLLDRHLLTVTTQESGEPRFTVPEPVRSLVRETLHDTGRADAALDRHAEEYRRLVTAAELRLAGTDQATWLRLLAAEHPNVMAALHRLRERGEREAVASFVLACRVPWLAQGRLTEGLDWCDRTAEDEPGALSEPLRARLVDMSGTFAAALGDADLAVRRHRRALALCKRLGDRRQTALVSARMGAALLRLGDHQGAQAALGPSLTALESLGASGPEAEAAVALAGALRGQGDGRTARELRERGVEAFRRLRDARGLAGALCEVAAAAEDDGDPDAALRSLREALRLLESVGERSGLPAALESFALLLLRTAPAQAPRVVRLLAACEALRGRLAIAAPQQTEVLESLRARMHWTGFAAAWAEGLRLSPEGAVAEALAVPVAAPETEAEPPGTQRLTPRQVQVAMLVAEGLTNKQIAGRLDISEWTVVNHVRQVMRRLGCSSRVQVAWVVGRWQ
ncbi:non-specific serine/threonine protein kinase [Streptomyces olivoverticillatus]|uniref:Non-specific serine/threonine protein kinase n=1 Tax=Streptomyces olivoverticillatus TaxID=66427 RepID=A0A7W7LMA9_9ACTN|nr:LuxR C-terminal-related transcriptional regulator [Streptomyces olivoverticillatus]MBB4892318.1 non-specific serine/threonine protein kinase [Streptomyces olivoverticillatus]